MVHDMAQGSSNRNFILIGEMKLLIIYLFSRDTPIGSSKHRPSRNDLELPHPPLRDTES
jgi:hypothetical protein